MKNTKHFTRNSRYLNHGSLWQHYYRKSYQPQSSTETSQKHSTDDLLTVKTYDVKGNEVKQVPDKRPGKVITNTFNN